MSARRDRHAVAIVGLGPRGTYALERLLDRARELPPDAELEITAFEPHAAPGPGPVYDPAQPSYLRMNFAAELVDMWWPDRGLLPPERRLDFSAWRRTSAGQAAAHGSGTEQFPPRAEVGSYLEDGLRRLLAAAPASARVRIERAAVQALRPVGDRWELEHHDETGAAGARTARFDDVVLCTGHLPDPAAAAREGEAAGEPRWIEAVYPVERLTTEQFPAGTVVGVRGFALTFIDAALALTEGRGGRFHGGKSGAGNPVLSYEAGGAEPAAIHPFSRSGRPMLAKPDPGLASSLPGVEGAGAAGRERLLGGSGLPTVAGTLLPQLTGTAERMLAAMAGDGEAEGPAAELDRLLATRHGSDPDEPVAEQLRRSVEIGAGRARPDAAWALGQSWRSLYPAIVERFGADRLPAREWPAFRRLAAEMERISFGPPLVNAAKLLALIDSGLVKVGIGPRLPAAAPAAAEVLVDAVSPPPGAAHLTSGPIGALLDAGLLRIPPGRRGIELGPEAQCISAAGEPVRGLAALGRISEDWVVGNDTLNRRLHPHVDRWATAVVRRAAGSSRAVTVPRPCMRTTAGATR